MCPVGVKLDGFLPINNFPKKRMDESEISTKKMLKTVLALTALSLGMDVSTLL